MQEERSALRTAPPKPPRLKINVVGSAEAGDAHAAILLPATETAREATKALTADSSKQATCTELSATRQPKQKKHLQFQSPLEARRQQKNQDRHFATNYATILLSERKERSPLTRNAIKNIAILAVPEATVQTNDSAVSAANISAAAKGTGIDEANNSKFTRKNQLAYGCTSLMHACQNGDIVEVLEQLRSKPERLRQRDSRNKNALHYCAAQSAQKRDLVAAASIAIAAPELLESADEDGFTPLHLAVIQGNLAMVNLLLANKADVNAVDNEGHSVVHWATVCGEVEALRSVLSAGANVAIPDINGGSPLHYAAQMCGANYDNKLGQGNSTKLALEILGVLLAHPQISVDVQDKDGRQPLLWAASAGSAKAIISLVKAGARVESADKDGLTALHCAASRGHTECLDTLISLCGAPTDLIDSNGCTALHYAVTLGHADATSRLLDLEADPNRQDRKGRTPAHCGCSKGQFETVKLLKERGANLWLRNAKGDLPVHEAASSGRRELVAWLLDQRPNQVNTTSNDGRSLLHISAANDYTDMCKMLLDAGGDINAIYRNSKGVATTPLDCALQRGNRSTAKFLQSNGGLPASKLRLAARRSNPFHDTTTDMVRPLKYAEKEEIHDLRNSKKYVVYMKRSDSDGGRDGDGDDGSCSCTERTYKREQRYAHKCRRHRQQSLRRRTNSCGEPKESGRADEGSDICRSKSNIEIRRRKSKERYASSSEWEADEDDEDSCENCCYHKRQKQKVIQRKRTTSLKRSKDLLDSDGEHKKSQDSSTEKQEKHIKEPEVSKEKQIEIEKEKSVTTASRPGSKSSTRSRPQSATKRQTPPSSAAKQATFIKSPPATAAGKAEIADDKISTHALELTDEDDQAAKAVEVVTQVDVHRDADEAKQEETATGIASEKDEDEQKDIKETRKASIEQEIEQVLKIAATAIASECKNGDSKVEQPQAVTAQASVEKNGETKSAGIQENNTASSKENQSSNSTIKVGAAAQEEREEAAAGAVEAEAAASATAAKPETENGAASTTEIPSTTQARVSITETKSIVDDTNTSKEPRQAFTEDTKKQREQETRRSFTLLPSDSADEDEEIDQTERKSSFQILNSDESIAELDALHPHGAGDVSDSQVFQIIPSHSSVDEELPHADYDEDYEEEADGVEDEQEQKGLTGSPLRLFAGTPNRHGIGNVEAPMSSTGGMLSVYDSTNGRKRRLKRRVKSGGAKTRSNWKSARDVREGQTLQQQSTKDHDSGFEPSPRTSKTKIPAPRNIFTAYTPRRTHYTTLDGRSCSSRLENRKPGDKSACDMTAVTRSIQRNIRRYYMERKIFQHLLELKSLQIRSNKLNEAVLVKRAVDDYHKSCSSLGGETGTRLRRYSFSEYSFKNFELFLYETLKALQKPGTYNFQNINEVYEEAERRLSPDYNAYEKALHCTTKTHRCPHAIHAYTGIPCAAYIPMMNHHTMPKFGFGPYKKSGVGSFYLPKILTKSNSCGDAGAGAGGGSCSGKMALELTHGKSKQLISLPSDKLDSNKRYYVTFTVKETSGGGGSGGGGIASASATADKQQNDGNETTGK